AFGTQRLGFDAATGLLTARGALAERTVATLRQVSWDPAFTDPLEQLVAASFHPPVTDRYGYNAGPSPGREHVVNDLMLEVDVAIGADAVVSLDLSDGRAAYRLTLDSVARRVTIERQGGTEPLHEASFEPREQNGRPLRIALAVIDGTATAVIDGEEPFAAIGHGRSRSPRPAAPPRVGTSGDALVRRIMLYRDIYYTRGRGRNAVTEPHRLAADEYFVLGDNSPVSLDSRGWEQPAVPARLLIGKPFVVHLPSRPGSFAFGGSERTFRVPDFSRVRLIR
ncbi:MAG: S26 family signal peptidase, partial [Planctomycetota bacterium]